MRIYLAGGGTGNLYAFFLELAKVYLAGNNGKKGILAGSHIVKDKHQIKEAMKVYLAGSESRPYIFDRIDEIKDAKILESFYYLQKDERIMALNDKFGDFLLDSGAFTFIQNTQSQIDWDSYIERYAEFINKYEIQLFFELDIDSIVGLDKVEYYRNKLEQLTGKHPIPVWHKNRGKDYFIRMVEEYPYVAIGGIVTEEIPKESYEKLFPWFIQTAHRKGVKIHGLGYTGVANLKKYHFDSVDSTAWLYGNRGGYLYIFNPSTGLIDKIPCKDNQRLNSRAAAVHNFAEWVKFSKYAEIYL